MTLLLAIIGHLVGYYILQNDFHALNKKASGCKGLIACTIHATLWTLAVVLFAGWPIIGCSTAILFATHWVQDRTGIIMWWMTKVNGQTKFATGPCAPWSIIVVDNVWHIVAIWAVWKFALNSL